MPDDPARTAVAKAAGRRVRRARQRIGRPRGNTRKVRAPRKRRCRITSGGGDPRESATESRPPSVFRAARVKGCGKSAPRGWQQARHGKPHREQDRIGAARRFGARASFRPAARVGCLSTGASRRLEEWSPLFPYRRRTEPGLQILWHFGRRRRFARQQDAAGAGHTVERGVVVDLDHRLDVAIADVIDPAV